MTSPGIFLALEGGEGAGKSTLATALAAFVSDAGREALVTREPGGTPAGEIVRTLLHEDLVPWAETFAFLAARAQIVADVIRPALQRGAVVICDRFEASTFAYQGYARGLDLATLRNLNRLATGGLSPSLTLLLDIDPTSGLQRKHGEDEAIRTGLESIAFHKKVRSGYFAMAGEAPPGSWIVLDARRSPASIVADAWSALELLVRTE